MSPVSQTDLTSLLLANPPANGEHYEPAPDLELWAVLPGDCGAVEAVIEADTIARAVRVAQLLRYGGDHPIVAGPLVRDYLSVFQGTYEDARHIVCFAHDFALGPDGACAICLEEAWEAAHAAKEAMRRFNGAFTSTQ